MGEEEIVVAVKLAENGGSVLVVETSDDLISKEEGGKVEVKEKGEDNMCDVICQTEAGAEEPTATVENESTEELVDEKKLSGEEMKDVKESEDTKEEEKREPRAVATEEDGESKEKDETTEKEDLVTQFVGEELDTEEAVPMEETVTETTVVECVTTETVQVVTEVMEFECETKEVEKKDVIMETVEEDSKPKEIEEVAERVEPGKELTGKEGELNVAAEAKEKAEGKEEVKEKDESKEEIKENNESNPELEAKEMEENKQVEAEEKEENKDEVKVDGEETEIKEQETKEDMEVQGKEESKEDMRCQEEESKEVEEAKEEESKDAKAENEEGNKDMEVEDDKESKDDAETQEKEESEDKVHNEVEGIKANSKQKKSRGKKRSRSRSTGKSKVRVSNDITEDVKLKKELEPKTPVTYVNDRPVRERKSVERLVAVVDNDSRELHIIKGHGTALKDIPNVSYKISRAKTDENFKLLHMVLYGRRGKAIEVKHNVSQFSGFVWHGDEEKQRLKIKEKLDKYAKDKLLEFCDLLDIPIPKASSIRKEDVLLKLIDFLEAPNATTDVLLGEKEQGSKGSKRKRPVKQNSSSGVTPSKKSAKRQRKAVEYSKEEAKSPVGTDDEPDKDGEMEEEENEKDVQDQIEDEKHTSDEEKENESDEGSAEKNKKRKRISSSGKKEAHEVPTTRKRSTPHAKVTQKKSLPNSSKVGDDESPKMLSGKSKDVKIAKEAPSTPKSAPKEKNGKKISKGKETPSDSELRDTICEILKEVDFNTATFTDILQRLGKKYKDLTSRKASIKQMIQEELTKLADEADEEEEEDEDGNSDSEKEKVKAAEHKVKA